MCVFVRGKEKTRQKGKGIIRDFNFILKVGKRTEPIKALAKIGSRKRDTSSESGER